MNKILVINQDKGQGDSLADKLRTAGYEVSVVTNEDEALQVLQVPEKTWQRILSIIPTLTLGPLSWCLQRFSCSKTAFPFPYPTWNASC